MNKIAYFVLLSLAMFSCTSNKVKTNVSEDTSSITLSVPQVSTVDQCVEILGNLKNLDPLKTDELVSLAIQFGTLTDNLSSEEKKEVTTWTKAISEEDHAYMSILAAIYYFQKNNKTDQLNQVFLDFKKLQDTK